MRFLIPIFLLPLLAAFVLTGCATHSAEQAQADPATVDAGKCQAAGYHPQTPEFEKCLAKLADMRAQAETNDRAALAGRLQGRPPPGFDTGGPPRL